MLTLPRYCHVGLVGADVRAYSRVYIRRGIRVLPSTNSFGIHMDRDTRIFQHNHALTVDGIIGPKTFALMVPYFDAYGKWLLALAIKSKKEPTARQLIVAAAVTLYNHRPIPYQEVRPYPRSLQGIWEIGSDCSGTSMGCYRYAHGTHSSVPDPSGYGFDGYGSTYTMINHGTRVWTAQPGDLAFYYPDYHHVGVYLGNDRVFSHGGSGDPRIIPLSWATMIRSYVP